MATQESNLKQLMRAGGIVKRSDWTYGSGNYITQRRCPIYAQEFKAVNQAWNPTFVNEFFKANPRVKGCVAITSTN